MDGKNNRHGKVRNACKILVMKLQEKRSFGRRKRKWEDNIKLVLQQIGCDFVDWIELAQYRVKCRKFMKTITGIGVP
jgi:hypothetical protein